MPAFPLGARVYARKKDAVADVRRILHGSFVGVPLGGADSEIIRSVLDLHPGVAEKTAKGVAGIVVREVEYRPGIIQRCFFIQHPDGSETDFSFLVALGMAPSGPTMAAAARHAVAPLMHQFKMSRFGSAGAINCEISGERISWDDAHVDHAAPWPFSRIVSEFARQCGVPAIHDEDGLRTVFTLQADAERFVTFHNDIAVLQVICRRLNMAKGARAAVPATAG